ncbi:hypothetical protein D3C76_1365060 [compost metagenome]
MVGNRLEGLVVNQWVFVLGVPVDPCDLACWSGRGDAELVWANEYARHVNYDSWRRWRSGCDDLGLNVCRVEVWNDTTASIRAVALKADVVQSRDTVAGEFVGRQIWVCHGRLS